MRTRLLASVAVLAAALLAPSAALAAVDPPTGAAAASPTATSPVTVTWNDVAVADGYRVFRANADCTTGLTNISNLAGGDVLPGVETFADSSPLTGTHCYFVRAFVAAEESPDSNHVLVTYDQDLPSGSVTSPVDGAFLSTQPGPLVVTSADADDATSGVQSVQFFASPAGLNAFAPIGTTSSGPPYNVSWAPPDGTYDLYATITDNVNHSIDTATVLGVVVDGTLPTTPVAPTGATPVKVAPSITFSATTDPLVNGVASGIDHYDVYRDGSKVNVSAIPAGGPYAWSDVAGQSTSPASGSHNYAYTVVAFDKSGNQSAQSPALVILMDTVAPTTPAAPTGATPVNVAPTITVTTTTDPGGAVASGVDHYDVYRDGSKVNVSAIAAGGPYVWSDVAGQSTSPASGSHNYSYTVVAVDVAGNQSAPSAARVILMDTAAPTTPAAPTGSTPVNAGPTIVVTTTTDPGGAVASGVDHYDVYRDGSKVNVSAIPEVGPHGWSDVAGQSTSPASGSHSYSYTVVAIDAAGNQSAQSAARVILLDSVAPTTPGAPTGLSPVSAAPTITVTTTTDPGGGLASGVDHYDVYRDGSKVNASAIPAGGPYAWSDVAGQSSTPASGSHAYAYTVVAVDAAGNQSAQSASHTIVLDPGAVSAPTSVTAVATPTNQAPQVSWGAPPGALFTVHHYNVYRDGAGTPVGVVNDPATTFTDTTPNLLDGTYTYQVVAAAFDGTTGVASGAVTVVLDTHAPAAPGGVSANAALDGSIGITWAASSDGSGSGVARYIVRRSLSSTPPASVADGDATCQVTATSCTDATTLTGKLYSYSVFAVDRAGNTSLAGASAAVTARDQLGPVQPSGLAATPGDASVALRWTAAGADDDVAGYVLVAKSGSQAPTSDTDGTRVCAAIVASSTACTATGLTNGATYTFGLFALDEALNRSQPATVSAAPNGKVSDTKAPAAISKLKAKVSGHKVTLTWANPADKDFDHVEITAGARKPAALKASKRVYSGKGTKTGITLAPGQSRWFVVVAYDAAGNASPPASVHVTIAPASLFGPAPSAKVHGKVRLSWPVAKGARYYNVQLYAGKKRIFVSWPNGRALKVPRAKLKRGTKYTWYVWPGLGAKAKARYGKLIGKNTFTFAG